MSTEPANPPADTATAGWPPGCASGVGSMPGLDPLASMRMIADASLGLPFLAELPARGPGADLVGRAGALLVDLPIDLQPAGWRLVPRPGLDLRRARDMWDRDVEAVSIAFAGYAGPLKVAVAGPWTLVASLELTRGDKALADPGAVRDVAASLAEGIRQLLTRLTEAVPGARPVLQLDEPSLPAVLAGRVASASGFATLPVPESEPVREHLATVLAAGPHPGVHCCAARVPWELLRRAGAGWVGVDVAQLSPRDDDELGAALEAGIGLIAGVLATTDRALGRPVNTLAGLRALTGRLGLPIAGLLPRLALSPACGLALASPSYAGDCLAHVAEVARTLTEEQQ